MPQTICTLCADKINDFFEYREMCGATNIQTRKLLGIALEVPKRKRLTDKVNIMISIIPKKNSNAKPLCVLIVNGIFRK